MVVRFTASLDSAIHMNIRCRENMTFMSMKTKFKVKALLVLFNLVRTFSILAIIYQSLKRIFIKEFNARMKLRDPFRKIKRDIMPKKIYVKA